jgi:hypothetical protein
MKMSGLIQNQIQTENEIKKVERVVNSGGNGIKKIYYNIYFVSFLGGWCTTTTLIIRVQQSRIS